MVYKSILLKQELIIDEIISIHYFEYSKNYHFEGEAHDFWEFLCVDKGEVEVKADTKTYHLKKDEIIFHKPNEFHTVRSNGHIAPNLVVISFHSNSSSMSFFEDKILQITNIERIVLAEILREAKSAFQSDLGDPDLKELKRKTNTPIGCEQLIKINLEHMLIQLIRGYTQEEIVSLPEKITKQSLDHELYQRIIRYFHEHVSSQISIKQICQDNLISRSKLQRLFHNNSGLGVMGFFTNIKIEKAKQMIREQSLNFTQIADELGYSSIHYFSRQFKHMTGMTPTEYDSSIKILTEK